MPSIKSQAHKLVDSLGEDATWEELVDLIALQEAIEQGRADIRAGRVLTTQQVRERLGLRT